METCPQRYASLATRIKMSLQLLQKVADEGGVNKEVEDRAAAERPGMTARQKAKETADRKARLAAEAAAATASAASGVKRVTKAQRDREADVKRGPPPIPKRSFRAPAVLLPEIIASWELLHVRPISPFQCLWPLRLHSPLRGTREKAFSQGDRRHRKVLFVHSCQHRLGSYL